MITSMGQGRQVSKWSIFPAAPPKDLFLFIKVVFKEVFHNIPMLLIHPVIFITLLSNTSLYL